MLLEDRSFVSFASPDRKWLKWKFNNLTGFVSKTRSKKDYLPPCDTGHPDKLFHPPFSDSPSLLYIFAWDSCHIWKKKAPVDTGLLSWSSVLKENHILLLPGGLPQTQIEAWWRIHKKLPPLLLLLLCCWCCCWFAAAAADVDDLKRKKNEWKVVL